MNKVRLFQWIKLVTLFLTFISILILQSCNEQSEVQCNCWSSPIEVQLEDPSGNKIAPDSIQFQFENGAVETYIPRENEPLSYSIGSNEGDYKVWVFKEGVSSDTISISVKLGGTKDCQTPSTQELVFVMAKDSTLGEVDQANVGGCGESVMSSSSSNTSSSSSELYSSSNPGEVISITTDSLFNYYFEQMISDEQVLFKAKVSRLLSDDTIGDRHQRFIVELQSKQTLLVAHNIDLAPRVENIVVGSEVLIYGEYEYNDEGGVVHWTHRDPDREHVDGYIEFEEKRYW